MYETSFTSLDPATWTVRSFYEPSSTGLPSRLANWYAPGQVSADGALHIGAERQDDQYLTGWIDTAGKRAWRYGYFEARMRYPDAPGAWTQFFLINEHGYPPEIDAGEIFTNDGRLQFCVRRGDVDFLHQHDYGAALLGNWHVFSVLWEPGQVTWFIDGEEYWREREYVPGVAMAAYIILGMGEWYAPDDARLPAALDVDYFRVWQTGNDAESV